MVQITVTTEQAMRIGQLLEPIEILDAQGNSIGFFMKPALGLTSASFTSEEIAEAKRRSKSSVGGRTTQEVFERLSKLESR